MDETITDTEEMVDPAALAARLAEEMPADIAEALNGHIPQVSAAVLQNLTLDRAVAVLDTPGLRDASEIIESIPRDRVVPMLSGMSADRVADVFLELDEPVDEPVRVVGEEEPAILEHAGRGQVDLGRVLQPEAADGRDGDPGDTGHRPMLPDDEVLDRQDRPRLEVDDLEDEDRLDGLDAVEPAVGVLVHDRRSVLEGADLEHDGRFGDLQVILVA